MRKRSSQPQRPLTPGQITALSDQFIFHPASRSIDEIEMAGEIMRDLLKQRDELLAAAEAIEINAEECMDFDDCTAMLVQIDDYHKLMEAIAGVKGGEA